MTLASTVESLSWEEFLGRFQWNQGEHVGMIGPTGSGKTTLALHLLPMRNYVTILATKPRDPTLDKFGKALNFRRTEEWRPRHWLGFKRQLDPRKYPRRMIWPNAKKLDSIGVQRDAFQDALGHMYVDGGWCVYCDELWVMMKHLGLEKEIKTYLQQSRSLNISLVVATQRPAFIPLEVYDQSTHLFFWRDNDERNLKRISGIGWRSARLIQQAVSELALHDVLYIHTRDGTMIQTRPPDVRIV